MRKKPLVSVLLPVYNECRFLKKAIESIINQSYSNIEIIVVNDGSTNSEVEKICLEYIDKIVYLKKENGGVASALNCAINVARGEYFARMDGDDISYPERIYKQVEFLENNRDIDICGTNYEYINENDLVVSRVNLPLTDSEIKVRNIFQNSLGHPSIMFRRTVFTNSLRYDENTKAEDYELWLRIEEHVRFANLKECLIGYRRHESGVTTTHSEEIDISVLTIIKKHLNKLTNNEFENISEYSFGRVGFMIKHIKEIWPFLREQIYIYSIILRWNEESRFYDSFHLAKMINERWAECLNLSGLKFFLVNENRNEFLKIHYFIDNESNCEKFYKIVTAIIDAQINTSKTEKRYLIYSVGTRGQMVYKELFALSKQQKIYWDMVGFGDKRAEPEKLFSWPVYSINRINDVIFDYIIIASNKYFEEIRAELITEGVKSEKILDSNWIQWIEMYTN